MRKIKILKPLTNEEIQRLTKIMKCCNSNHGSQFGDWKKTKKICEIIISLNEGKSAQDVANEYNVGRTTVFNYIKKYNDNPYFMTHQKKQTSILEKYEFKIASLLKEKHITKYKEAHRVITKKYNINISYERTRVFLMNHDFFKDENKKYINHKRNSATKHRMMERNTVTPLISYLVEHPNEIEQYVNSIASACDYDASVAAERVKEKFNLNESKKDIEKWIQKNTSL